MNNKRGFIEFLGAIGVAIGCYEYGKRSMETDASKFSKELTQAKVELIELKRDNDKLESKLSASKVSSIVTGQECSKTSDKSLISGANKLLEVKYQKLENTYRSCLSELAKIDTKYVGSKTKFTGSSPPEEISKILVTSAEANTSFSAAYDANKSIDSNLNSYWSTTPGRILDTKLEYYFEKPKSLLELHIYSPKKGDGYTQPRQVLVSFYDESNGKLSTQTINLVGPYNKWQKIKMKPVDKVSRVVVEPKSLTVNIASYLTINEIAFYGN